MRWEETLVSRGRGERAGEAEHGQQHHCPWYCRGRYLLSPICPRPVVPSGSEPQCKPGPWVTCQCGSLIGTDVPRWFALVGVLIVGRLCLHACLHGDGGYGSCTFCSVLLCPKTALFNVYC